MTGEWIVYVGTRQGIQPYVKPDKTKVIDAQGRLVLPGFNDAHVHILSGGRSLLNLDFRNLPDIKVIQQMVKDRVAQAQPDEVIIQSIMLGKKGEYSRMPAFKPILTPEDANAVMGYIRETFWKKPAE